IVLDKTGTVTTGEMELLDVVVADGADADALLATVAALESGSEHPIARAIVDGATARLGGGTAQRIDDFRNHEGLGVSGRISGSEVLVGRRRLLLERGIELDDALLRAADEAEALGRTPVLGAVDGVLKVVVVVADTPRPSSRAAIVEMRR